MIPAAIRAVGAAAAEAPPAACYLVGGSVRDLLARREMQDVDVSVEGSADGALALANRLVALPGWRLDATHARFGTATLQTQSGQRVDIAATRTETYPRPAALPVVTCGTGIAEDLARRDFTVNAMARRIEADGSLGPLIDPHGGKKDLEDSILRLLHDGSLVDDPTRVYRAIKYAVRLGMTLEDDFKTPLKRARDAKAFQNLSGDRMRRGIEEIFLEGEYGKSREDALTLLQRLSLFGDVLPAWTSPSSPSKQKSPVVSRSSKPEAHGAGETGSPSSASEAIWAFLFLPLSPENRRHVAERLLFSRKLRRAAGVPLR